MAYSFEGTKDLIENIVIGISDVKGQDIEMIDLRKVENRVCDFYIICSCKEKRIENLAKFPIGILTLDHGDATLVTFSFFHKPPLTPPAKTL